MLFVSSEEQSMNIHTVYSEYSMCKPGAFVAPHWPAHVRLYKEIDKLRLFTTYAASVIIFSKLSGSALFAIPSACFGVISL